MSTHAKSAAIHTFARYGNWPLKVVSLLGRVRISFKSMYRLYYLFRIVKYISFHRKYAICDRCSLDCSINDGSWSNIPQLCSLCQPSILMSNMKAYLLASWIATATRYPLVVGEHPSN